MSECRGDREPERLARFTQQVRRTEGIFGYLEGIVACGACRKHASGNGNRRIRDLIHSQRIVRPVNSERRINDGEENLQLQSRGHARYPIRSVQWFQILGKSFLYSARAVEPNIQRRATEYGAVQ